MRLNLNATSVYINYSSVYVTRIVWGLLFVAVCAVYWPGLGGPFVLDDFGSIAALGSRGGVVDWDTFKAFVLGGTSGPTGRPVSLLTFLIDANDWPAESWPFKRTNLVIHCLCGVALGLLIRQILRMLRFQRSEAEWIVIVSVGIWLLHPFLVSTTLYVVQRMAQLSTLFMLTGLILYVHGRMLLPHKTRRAYLIMSVSFVVFGSLAILSKENGVLMPLLAGVIELTVVANQKERLGQLNRYWSTLFFVVPAAVIFAYLGSRVVNGGFFDVVAPRDFSLYERSITQPRILFDYLQHWFIPKLYTTGVFQDHFIKSTGLLSPPATVLLILTHVSVVALALLKRRRWPLFALAALFFYASHLLESTVANLELYFEHRNYLATVFLFLPLIALIQRRVKPRQFALASVAILLLLGGFTRYSSSVWATWPGMVEASAYKAPTSARAQAQYSVLLFNAGRHEEALEVLDRAIETIPKFVPLLTVNRLFTLCQMNLLTSNEFETVAPRLSRVLYDSRMIMMYSTLVDSIAGENCSDVTTDHLTEFFTQMLNQPNNANSESLEFSQIQYLIGLTHAHSGRGELAVTAFQASLNTRPGPGHAMQMAAVLASNEFGVEALNFSDLALQQLAVESTSFLDAATVSESDIQIFQDTVRADIKSMQERDRSREKQ